MFSAQSLLLKKFNAELGIAINIIPPLTTYETVCVLRGCTVLYLIQHHSDKGVTVCEVVKTSHRTDYDKFAWGKKTPEATLSNDQVAQ